MESCYGIADMRLTCTTISRYTSLPPSSLDSTVWRYQSFTSASACTRTYICTYKSPSVSMRRRPGPVASLFPPVDSISMKLRYLDSEFPMPEHQRTVWTLIFSRGIYLSSFYQPFLEFGQPFQTHCRRAIWRLLYRSLKLLWLNSDDCFFKNGT